MTDQETPLPPPQPNDGSLNTELPPDQNIVAPQKQFSLTEIPRSKRILVIAAFGLLAVTGLVYTITSSPQFSSARNRFNQPEIPKMEPDKPTSFPPLSPEQELDSLDLGDPETELKLLDRDINAL